MNERDRMRVLKRELNDDLRKAISVHEGMGYDKFVVKVLRIDQARMKDRKKKSITSSVMINNDDKERSIKSQLQQSQRFRSYRSSRPKSAAR